MIWVISVTYDAYRNLFIIFGIISIVMLIVTILIFVLMRVPRAIGILSGSTAKKAIKSINDQSKNQRNNSNLTAGLNKTKNPLVKSIANESVKTMVTEQIDNNPLYENEQTSVLEYEKVFDKTVLLDKEPYKNTAFEIVESLYFINSDEKIQ